MGRRPTYYRSLWHRHGFRQPVQQQAFVVAVVLVLILALGYLSRPTSPVRELPAAETDVYSGYRWGNCDTHPAQCSREYSSSDLVTVPQYQACRREHGCPCSEQRDGSTVIYTFSTFNRQCQNRRFVRLEEQQPVYVYGRVAREYDKLKKDGIDPLRLESIVSSLSQISSGNAGEATALKRPELEARYWDQMKAFVEQNPKSATPRKVQELFKRWYKNDPSILPFKGKATPLEPVTGDFKWRIHNHSQLLMGQRYMSTPFYVGGYPWRLIYSPQSEWDPTQLAMYLTPVASQQAGPGWLRQVSFSMRIYGHDDPTQSIWANWNHTYSAMDEDIASGFAHFKDHETLHQPGRGYLRGDLLEIRAIVRLEAVANMGPFKYDWQEELGLTGLVHKIKRETATVASYAVNRSTEYVPGLALLVSALPPDPESSEGLPPWERLHRRVALNEEIFSAWGANLRLQVARPETAREYLLFMQMAAAVAILFNLAGHIQHCATSGSIDLCLDTAFLTHALASPQLYVTNLASMAVLTRPAALSVVAYLIVCGGQAFTMPSRFSKGAQASRILCAAFAMDLMLSGGEVKLFFPALLARQLLSTDRPLVKCCEGALHLTFMPALLLECLLHPQSAHFSPSSWSEEESMSESTGYANVCMLLFMFTAIAAIFPRIQPPTVLFIFGALLIVRGPGVTLLWLGICLTWSFWEYSFWSYPWRVLPSVCSKLLQVVSHCFRLLHRAPAFSEGHMPEAAGLVDKLKADPVLAKTGSAEAVKVKTESAGAKAGPVKRGKQKPVPSKTAHVSASQQKQLPTSQSSASKAFDHSDATATIQLSPSAAAALPIKRDCEFEITPSTGQQQGEGPRSPVARPTARGSKGKAGKRKASKGARSTPELRVKVTPSNESPAAHTLPAASPQLPDSRQQEFSASLGELAPTEEAVKPEPATQALTTELTPQKPSLDAQPGAPHAAPESTKSTQPPTAISEQAAESLGSRTPAPVRMPPPLGSGQVASTQGLGRSTPVAAWRPATPGTGQPAGRRPVPVRLGASTEQRGGPSAAPAGWPPPLEYLMPLVSPKRSSAQHASAEDLLLALLKGSGPVAPSQPSSAAQTQPPPAMQPSAKRAEASAGKALPQSSAANGRKGAGPQQVAGDVEDVLEEKTCVMCWERPREATLAPCGHRALCSACTELLLQRGNALCPICRRGVLTYILREFDA